MYGITVGIAERCVEICAIFPQSLTRCIPYRVERTADFCIQTSFREIDAERGVLIAKKLIDKPSDALIESAILLRKLADGMIDYDAFLMHGAVVAVNGNAYMFAAKSGVGKTTHIYKWLENVPNAYVVNGDKPLIISDGEPRVCGTPWCGKERMGCNEIVPLKAIVIMDRSDDNHIEQISFTEAFPRLLEQTHRPKDADKMRKTVRLLAGLATSVKFYRFNVNNFKEDAFKTSYKMLIRPTDSICSGCNR